MEIKEIKASDYSKLRTGLRGEKIITFLLENRGDTLLVTTGTFPEGTPDSEIKEALRESINDFTESRIFSGFSWKGHQVWLNQENQLNYRSLLELNEFPLKIRDANQGYIEFSDSAEFGEFWRDVQKYIRSVVQRGWYLKDTL